MDNTFLGTFDMYLVGELARHSRLPRTSNIEECSRGIGRWRDRAVEKLSVPLNPTEWKRKDFDLRLEKDLISLSIGRSDRYVACIGGKP